MACYYLDCGVLALVAALLLDRILLPDSDPDQRSTAARTDTFLKTAA